MDLWMGVCKILFQPLLEVPFQGYQLSYIIHLSMEVQMYPQTEIILVAGLGRQA
jgi:hypothetical protein